MRSRDSPTTRASPSGICRSWADVPEARAAIERALASTLPIVRMNAALQCAEFPDRRLSEALVPLLDDPIWTVRWRAVRALGDFVPSDRLRTVVACSRPRKGSFEYDQLVDWMGFREAGG